MKSNQEHEKFSVLKSVSEIRRMLILGVRYVDVDVWDGDDGQPYCNHGYTLTSRIPFTHVIQAINQSAFVTSG